MTPPGGKAPAELEMVEKHGQYGWERFKEHEGFNERWWSAYRFAPAGSTFFEIRCAGVEVARLQLVEGVHFAGYVDAPDLGDTGLEIAFVEVASDCRRQGIGRRLVALLYARYPKRRLFGFSEGADDFWSSLGWDRYERAGLWRPLYIQPLIVESAVGPRAVPN
jgi:ribosomal protein S18 acetylase RimI-like enzyme